jgi:hypothetical protein
MISLAPFLALRQIVFFVWVSLSEQKWVILAERRGCPVRLTLLARRLDVATAPRAL